MPKITVNGNFPSGAKALRGGGEDNDWRLWLDIFPEAEQIAQIAALRGKPLRITLED